MSFFSFPQEQWREYSNADIEHITYALKLSQKAFFSAHKAFDEYDKADISLAQQTLGTGLLLLLTNEQAPLVCAGFLANCSPSQSLQLSGAKNHLPVYTLRILERLANSASQHKKKNRAFFLSVQELRDMTILQRAQTHIQTMQNAKENCSARTGKRTLRPLEYFFDEQHEGENPFRVEELEYTLEGVKALFALMNRLFSRTTKRETLWHLQHACETAVRLIAAKAPPQVTVGALFHHMPERLLEDFSLLVDSLEGRFGSELSAMIQTLADGSGDFISDLEPLTRKDWWIEKGKTTIRLTRLAITAPELFRGALAIHCASQTTLLSEQIERESQPFGGVPSVSPGDGLEQALIAERLYALAILPPLLTEQFSRRLEDFKNSIGRRYHLQLEKTRMNEASPEEKVCRVKLGKGNAKKKGWSHPAESNC